MHYCLHLFTDGPKTEEEIEEILEPYHYGPDKSGRPI